MLQFTVTGQKLARVDKFEPATDSKAYLQAGFTFSGDWSGATKTAIFRDDVTGESYAAPLNSSGACTVPAEVLTRSDAVHYRTQGDHFHVSLRGDVGSKMITTNEVKIQLARSGYTEGETPAGTTPDAYSQFVANVAADAATATAAAREAAEAAHNVANFYANALERIVSGELVTVEDISPIEHGLRVRVHGKNLLCPQVKETEDAGVSSTWQCMASVSPGGKITLTRTGDGSGVAYARVGTVWLQKGKTYTFSLFDAVNVKMVLIWYKDTSIQAVPTYLAPFSPTRDMVVDLAVYMADNSTAGTVASLYLQVEEGEASGSYAPFMDTGAVTVTRHGTNTYDNAKTYTPAADGTVAGVRSIYPKMTIKTDTPGAIVEVTYHRDLVKVIEALEAALNN